MNSFDKIKPKLGASKEEGKAYHDVPYFGLEGPTHRGDTKSRVDKIVSLYEVEGKVGMDLGCNVGGISFGLHLAGASSMVGIDYDKSSISFANDIARDNAPMCEFYCMDIGSNEFWKMYEDVDPDFIVWLSNFMWISYARDYQFAVEMIERFKSDGRDLIFDSAQHGGDGEAGKYVPFKSGNDVYRMLNKYYSDIERISGHSVSWNKRDLFVCRA